jgi:hypothetical protein
MGDVNTDHILPGLLINQFNSISVLVELSCLCNREKTC